MKELIKIGNVVKEFGEKRKVRALDNVSIHIEKKICKKPG